jgi:hypothetical protein
VKKHKDSLKYFSEEKILCSAKYKNHKPYDNILEYFLEIYDDIDDYLINK